MQEHQEPPQMPIADDDLVRFAAVTSQTAVPIRLTVGQLWGVFVSLLSGFATVVGIAYWISADRADFKAELKSLRVDFGEQVEQNAKLLTGAIERLDSVWQQRLLHATHQITNSGAKQNTDLREAFLRLESRVPGEFPPAAWLEDVYRRDHDDLRQSVKEMKATLAKLQQQLKEAHP